MVWARDYSAEDAQRCDCDALQEALSKIPGAKRMVSFPDHFPAHLPWMGGVGISAYLMCGTAVHFVCGRQGHLLPWLDTLCVRHLTHLSCLSAVTKRVLLKSRVQPGMYSRVSSPDF